MDPIQTTIETSSAKPEQPAEKKRARRKTSGQVLSDITHGGHTVAEESPVSARLASGREDITLLKNAVGSEPEEILFSTPFDYLFSAEVHDPGNLLPPGPGTVAGLNALGDAMVEDAPAPGENPLQQSGNSTIPTVYTYWGQFIDHDLTANTDRDSGISDITSAALAPLDPDFVVNNLKNLRQPTANLDSVYGDGPTFDPAAATQAGRMYDGIKLRVGKLALNQPGNPPIPGDPIPPDRLDGPPGAQTFVSVDPHRDLPRIGALIAEGVVVKEDFPEHLHQKPNFEQLAFIADARNDENLIIAQFHTAALRFHNAMVDWVMANEPDSDCGSAKSEQQVFLRAQQLARWHYQWLVVHDFLKTMTVAGVVDEVLITGPRHYKPRGGVPYMPLEFSVAAYRYGHTMVRAAYDHNRNFGAPGRVIPSASFDQLFAFTGSGSVRNRTTGKIELKPFRGDSKVLPFNWAIEWDRFVDKGSAIPDHFARKIDTRLAPPLRDLVNQGNDPALDPTPHIKPILKRLARRNLLRGYHLSLPTGQCAASAMGVSPLTRNELLSGNSGPLNQVLEDHGFLEKTPLWFYVLKEAEVRANGNSLGELGSRIVCETIIGQLKHDPASYFSLADGWHPGMGARLPNGRPIVTIRDYFHFAGLIA